MSNLHETHISKTRRIVGYTLTIIPSLMLLMGGLMKISGSEEMQANFAKIPNFSDKMLFVGVLEIIILVLYWTPKTMNIGFFLLCSLCGGIIVAEIVSGEMPIPGIMLSVLFYVGTMLRKPSLSGLNL